MMSNKILLGMSGGTDSSVAAMLLQEQGYDVTGITFRFYDECEGVPQYAADAAELAQKLGIKHFVKDVRSLFRTEIIDYFINEYMCGRTPVPCVMCNNLLKWRLLVEFADENGITKIAMGHYANVVCEDNHYFVKEGADPDKDQSFFLWGLSQDIIKRMVLPLGGLTKKYIREYAEKRGFLSVATKKDSVGVCFCGKDYRPFLQKEIKDKSAIRAGNFISVDGKFLGRHKGYPFYTVGQRRGLGVNFDEPYFVNKINPSDNTVVLASEGFMYNKVMFLSSWCVVSESLVFNRDDVLVRIRYKKQHNYGFITKEADGRLKVVFDSPVSSIAPGQAACFYRDGLVLGGGIIN